MLPEAPRTAVRPEKSEAPTSRAEQKRQLRETLASACVEADYHPTSDHVAPPTGTGIKCARQESLALMRQRQDN